MFSFSEFKDQHPLRLETKTGIGSCIALPQKIGSDLILDTLLVQGAEGKIYRGQYQENIVIIKIAHVGLFTRRDKDFGIYALQYLNRYYPSIVPTLYQAFHVDRGGHMLIMEKLYPFIYTPTKEQILFKYVTQINSRGLIHGDISPGNIMEDKNGHPKLIDFSRVTLGTYFYSQDVSDTVALSRTLLDFKYSETIKREIGLLHQKLIDDSKLKFLTLSRNYLISSSIDMDLAFWFQLYTIECIRNLGLQFIKEKYPDRKISWFRDPINNFHPEWVPLRYFLEHIDITPTQFLKEKFHHEPLIVNF